ncbi:MAG: hypothetical protein P1U67_02560 [Alcanivoracaceae bacterium]|nr:hypothetical protein [Alcanivoracaceae bacterium]
MDLPYRDKFDSIPDVDPQKLVQYFNLEYGLEFGPEAKKFTERDFQYLGVYEIVGRETMVWSVAGVEVCATAQPYENSFILGMDKCPVGVEPVNQAK